MTRCAPRSHVHALAATAALLVALPAAAALLLARPAAAGRGDGAAGAAGNQHRLFTTDLGAERCTFADRGSNRYFVLEPGHQLRLEGQTRKGLVAVTITVLDETRVVDGVTTRVVEEYETLDGGLAELSRNFFAICEQTSDVWYFGEEVDLLASDEPASHAGSWLAGEHGAKAGIAMPGTFMLGARYAMEQAPGVAMDRAEHVAMKVDAQTPAGLFRGCVVVLETTPLEPGEHFEKLYAEGIGVVADQDDSLALVDWTPAVEE